MARRIRSPKLESADDKAQTCSSPVEIESGYSGSSERSARPARFPRRSAELNDALREQVDVLLHRFVDLVEQLVQAMKSGP